MRVAVALLGTHVLHGPDTLADRGRLCGYRQILYAISGKYMSGGVYRQSMTSVEKLDTRRPIGDINGDNTIHFADISPFGCLLTQQ